MDKEDRLRGITLYNSLGNKKNVQPVVRGQVLYISLLFSP